MSVIATVRDISHYNEIGDYDRLKAAADAFQIKITEGTTFVDDHALRANGTLGPHVLGTRGKPRAPYHFARPVSIPDQIRHFLDIKAKTGPWERPDMLDCEFAGITGAFIDALKREYRRQSGIQYVQIYLGVYELTSACPPASFWDADVAIQAARYRKAGAPTNTDRWADSMGFDHPGITTYQWDNATPLYPGGPLGDISYDRYPLTPNIPGDPDMPGIQNIPLPPSTVKPDGSLNVMETSIVLDTVGGAAGLRNFWVNIMANAGGLTLQHAHWRVLNDDGHSTTVVPLVPDGTLVNAGEIANPADNHAPAGAIGLMIDHQGLFGGTVALIWN